MCLDFLTFSARENSEQLFEMKILSLLGKVKLLNEIEKAKKYHLNGESRNPIHVLWIRTLFFVKQMADKLIDKAGYIHSFIEFIKVF